MSSASDISALYRDFTEALAEILAENVVGPARRGRLARARAVVKRTLNTANTNTFWPSKPPPLKCGKLSRPVDKTGSGYGGGRQTPHHR
jgi:hypothetical protein